MIARPITFVKKIARRQILVLKMDICVLKSMAMKVLIDAMREIINAKVFVQNRSANICAHNRLITHMIFCMIVEINILVRNNVKILNAEELANMIFLFNMIHINVVKLNAFTNVCFVIINVYSLTIYIKV